MTKRRFDSISGILNRSSTPTDPNSDVALTGTDSEDGLPETPSAEDKAPRPIARLRTAGASRPTRMNGNPAARTSEAADGGVRRIAFRLDPDLHEVLTTRAAAAKTSHGQVVLDSIEAAYNDDLLTRLVQSEIPRPKADGLFPQLNPRTSSARPTIPVEIRLPARAAATLDQLVEETAAESRTQLIVAALRQHLT